MGWEEIQRNLQNGIRIPQSRRVKDRTEITTTEVIANTEVKTRNLGYTVIQ